MPEPLTEKHEISLFDCGVASLNDWLRQRALKNALTNASKTFVVCSENVVIGYYCLAAGAVEHKLVSTKMKRNMPNPIPVMVLGRLAVDNRWRGLGIGKGLLKDAVLRTLSVSKTCGMRALLVHALSEDAKMVSSSNFMANQCRVDKASVASGPPFPLHRSVDHSPAKNAGSFCPPYNLEKIPKMFYQKHGFIQSPLEPMTLMLSLTEVGR